MMHAWVSDTISDVWGNPEHGVGLDGIGGCSFTLTMCLMDVFDALFVRRPWNRVKSSSIRSSWSEMIPTIASNAGLFVSSCCQQSDIILTVSMIHKLWLVTNHNLWNIRLPHLRVGVALPYQQPIHLSFLNHKNHNMGVSDWISPKQLSRIRKHRSVLFFSWADLLNILELCIPEFRVQGYRFLI